MSRRIIVFPLLVALMVFPSSILASDESIQEPPAQDGEIALLRAEIAELREIITSLKEVIISLQKAQPQQQISVGVMPIHNSWRISQVGSSFRQIVVSALNEAGVQAYESLDDETLKWVQRQDQLVRERWIDPVSAPRRGELKGVSHYLMGTVTQYEEDSSNLIIGGVIQVVGAGARVRKGSLIVDWRFVDATTGEVLEAFPTEAKLRREEIGGVIILGSSGFGGFSRKTPLPEVAARLCAKQAAEKIARLLAPEPAEPEPQVEVEEEKK